ncbi:MAG TPA: DUF4466 family protein [Chitinophagaceae bacterium]|nr:DUF4466 family protein [Chitinophagaceae bacterium]
MQFSAKYNHPLFLLAMSLLLLASCKNKEYALPTAPDNLQNDAIKRTLGPNIVGQTIEFAYAMAIKPSKGKLATCDAEASIAGAAGTFMDNKSYFTKSNGADSGVVVATPSVNSGNKTSITYNKDTSAATLRYYYVIPEAARGQSVSFTFTATSSNGEKISMKMGPYTISKMDMVRNLAVSNNNMAYISIADTAVYNAANAAANAAKIDLVYLYRNLTTSTFGHALVSPAADTSYLPGITLPTGVNRSTKTQKVFNMQDYNLARLQYGGIFVDDIDFQKIDLSNQPNYAINLKAEAGVWVETADKKYRAYIYINSVNANGSAVISMKRYAL